VSVALCACAYGLDTSLDISQYAHTAWKIRDGFTRSVITSIAQTQDGYLWLGTEFGLLRFDGVRALPWQPPAGERFPSDYIETLLVARDGTLWVGTLKGLSSWKDGRLTTYPQLAGAAIAALLEDREGTMWIGVVNGPPAGMLCAVKGGRTQCYGTGSFGRSVLALYEDRKGNLWVSAQSGVWRWAPGSPEQYTFPRGVLEANSLIEGDTGALLLTTNDGLKQLVRRKIQSYALPTLTSEFRPNRFFRSRDGGLWIGTRQGLLHLHDGRNDGFAAADGLSGNDIYTIFEGREGNVWVSTAEGLDRFREYAIPTISQKQGLSHTAAHSVQATEDGSIWIGTADGLNRWENDRVTVYGRRKTLGRGPRADSGRPNISSRLAEVANSGLPSTALSLAHARGRLWVSTKEGIFYFDSRRFTHAPGIPGGTIWPIAADEYGNVWVSNADAGLFCLMPGGAVQRIPWGRFKSKSPARALLPDTGGLWLGFYGGGIAYLKNGQIGASYTAADGLSHGIVSDLRRGSDGAVWVAAEGGLSRLKDGQITTLTGKNRLPCDAVHWSIEDGDHALWVYMPCGLVRIAHSELDAWVRDPARTVQTTIFDSSDGVESLGIYGSYGPHVTKSPDGKIWFLPRDGVSVIDPQHLPTNKLPPPVQIEQVIADRKTFGARTGQHIPPLTRDLEIDYTALSLVAPEKNHFKYKLEGHDADWQDVSNRRQAFYNDLPPRDYTFRVKASNNSNVWNDAGASLKFSIDAAYYQTNWFKALCVAAFLALLWLLYVMRVRQLAREFNMTLDARVNERTRIARELHDTLLQSFQGLMLRLQLVEELLPEGKAKKELEETLERGEQAIVEGRNTVQDLRTSTTTTNDLAQAVNALRDELAHDDRTTFRFLVEGTAQELRPIIRDELYRIAREALRNAFQHAQAEHIEAEITYGQRALRLRIRDDGRGLAADILEEGRTGHFGLPGMRERAKQMGAKLHIWSSLGAGTEIELTIAGAKAYASAPRNSRFRLFSKKVV
jgi:signal transduction histidine kinase/ligand-binding sensor domain-containing protein